MKNKYLGLKLQLHSKYECGVTPIATFVEVWDAYSTMYHVLNLNELFYHFYFNHYRTLL